MFVPLRKNSYDQLGRDARVTAILVYIYYVSVSCAASLVTLVVIALGHKTGSIQVWFVALVYRVNNSCFLLLLVCCIFACVVHVSSYLTTYSCIHTHALR